MHPRTCTTYPTSHACAFRPPPRFLRRAFARSWPATPPTSTIPEKKLPPPGPLTGLGLGGVEGRDVPRASEPSTVRVRLESLFQSKPEKFRVCFGWRGGVRVDEPHAVLLSSHRHEAHAQDRRWKAVSSGSRSRGDGVWSVRSRSATEKREHVTKRRRGGFRTSST